MNNIEKQKLILTINELIQNINKRIKEIASLYQDLEYEAASERFTLLIEDMAVLVEGIAHVRKNYIEELQEKLQMAVKEMKNKDYEALASILNFELVPVLEQWEEQMIHA